MKKMLKVDLGTIIQDAIIVHDMTQKQVAKAVNISQQTLSHIIHNRRTPNMEDFYALAKLLDLDIFHIFGLTDGHPYDPMDFHLYRRIQELPGEDKMIIKTMVDRLINLRNGNL